MKTREEINPNAWLRLQRRNLRSILRKVYRINDCTRHNPNLISAQKIAERETKRLTQGLNMSSWSDVFINSVYWWAVFLSVGCAVVIFLTGKEKDSRADKSSKNQAEKIAVLQIRASDALASQQLVEVELNKTKIQLAQTQRQLGPRDLSFSEKRYLIDALKDVKKEGKVCLTVYDWNEPTIDVEAANLTGDLAFVFESAGFSLRGGSGIRRPIEAGPQSKYNVGIEFQRTFPTPNAPLPSWVNVFVRAMHDLHYRVRDAVGNINCPPDCIIIEVGKKPPFPEE